MKLLPLINIKISKCILAFVLITLSFFMKNSMLFIFGLGMLSQHVIDSTFLLSSNNVQEFNHSIKKDQ
ncbi:hypothetical protein [Enterococcus sp. AZ126]|uniref:hypothetical protein n=1 Tax=Enterococcus sp. AZ126 TaxID=2774635 RepID=UPI003F25842E